MCFCVWCVCVCCDKVCSIVALSSEKAMHPCVSVFLCVCICVCSVCVCVRMCVCVAAMYKRNRGQMTLFPQFVSVCECKKQCVGIPRSKNRVWLSNVVGSMHAIVCPLSIISQSYIFSPVNGENEKFL